jgi:hypothetical protein
MIVASLLTPLARHIARRDLIVERGEFGSRADKVVVRGALFDPVIEVRPTVGRDLP